MKRLVFLFSFLLLSIGVKAQTCNASFGFFIQGTFVQFIDSSTFQPTTWIWTFGDGSASTLQHPNHTYNSPGVYNVCLVASNAFCSDTVCQSVFIQGTNCSVEIGFSINGNDVSFTSTLFPPTLPPTSTSYFWNFGDGTTSNQPNPVHTYLNPGTYLVCLQVSSGFCSAWDCDTVVIQTGVPGCVATIGYWADTMNNWIYFNSQTNFGTPNTLTYHWTFGDGNTSTSSNPYHYYDQPGQYEVCLYVTDGVCADTVCQMIQVQVPSYGIISGKVFIDNNNSGAYETGETLVPNAIVQLNGGGINYTVNAWNGEYAFYGVPVGNTYTVTLTPVANYNLVVPATGSYIINMSSAQVVSNQNFGLSPIPNQNDLSIDISIAGPARRGFSNNSICLTWQNQGTTNQNATVTFSLQAGLIYHSATPAPTTVSGNQLTWNLGSISPMQQGNICITYEVPLSFSIGNAVTFNASITPVSGDVNPANNTDQVSITVTASWDPNDKISNAVGMDNQGNIPLGTQTMYYTIRFQNLGTDTAFRVMILDTLDATKFNLATFRMISASHSGLRTELRNNIVQWTFDQIYLPHAAINPTGSMGFVQFAIDLNPGLPVGTQITNDASIYFDFNEPVITNTIVNTILMTVNREETLQSGKVLVYPNPMNETGIIEVFNPNQTEMTFILRDLTGKEVLQTIFLGDKHTFSRNGLSSGMYFYELSGNGNRTNGKLILE
ncbi:MAG: PKD domain-containing protein [Bacteroidia bacterium]|nr:PKD domain-containing protein [Bacteroidia bacterium]